MTIPHIYVHLILIQEVSQEAQTFDCSVQSHIQSQKHSHLRMAMFV